jgi:hypothetical protein
MLSHSEKDNYRTIVSSPNLREVWLHHDCGMETWDILTMGYAGTDFA